MTEIPKELTSELFSLIVGREVFMTVKNHASDVEDTKSYIDYNELYYSIRSHKWTGHSVNVDTLLAKMKALCIKKGYLPAVTVNDDLTIWMVLHNTHGNEAYSEDYIDDIEFDAVLKATHWVATEKGKL